MTTMQLPSSATLADAPALLAQLQKSLAEGSVGVRVDASALQSFDTSTIALLMHAHRLARAAGRSFEVVGAPPKLGELARLYGVEDLISLSSPGGTALEPSAAA
jgi:phospholipid transport system transporter-binding protein